MTNGNRSAFRLSDQAWRRIVPQLSSDPTVEEPPDEHARARDVGTAGSSLTVTTTASLLLSVAAAVGAYQQEWVVTLLAWAALAALVVFVRRAGIERQRRPRGLRGAGLTGMLVLCYAAWAYVAVAGWVAILKWLGPNLLRMGGG